MRPRDTLIGVLIAIAWGLNFVAIGEGLHDLPPLLFVALRFLLASIPVVLFVPRPDVRPRVVVMLGLFAGVGTFGLLFLGIAAGMPSGMSSVVLQAQMPFTVLLGALLLGERPSGRQLGGLAAAIAGLVVIAAYRGPDVPVAALLLVLAGGASWAAANVTARSAHSARPFSLLVHSSLVAGGCLLVLSVLAEGPQRDVEALREIGPRAVASLAYIAGVATLAGYGAWYWLLGRYESSTVSAFPLLAPVAALSSTWLVLGEAVSLPQLAGSLVVVGGVGVALWSTRPPRGGCLAATSARVGPAAGARHVVR